MTYVNETIDTKHRPSGGVSPTVSTVLAFSKFILIHPATFLNNRKMRPDEPRYVRPPRPYEIPAFREGMKHSTSNELYLRPTHYCNPREPEIIAMANELGAYEVPDYEFADAAYWFIKDDLTFEMLPLDSAAATLERGTGTCYHLVSLFNALCRAAGIKARYKLFAMNYDRYTDGSRRGGVDPLWDGLYNSLGYLMSEAESEVCIDGEWMVAHPVTPAEIQAAKGLPVTRFGEDSIGVFFDAVPGTIQHVESVPAGMNSGLKFLLRLSPATGERVAVSYQRATMYGRQVIDEAGGREAYDRMARERLKRASPTLEVKKDTALVFEA
ncbi:MAG: transglutaminase-like domain-containing protein [Halobacteriota archaeon]